MTAHTVRPTFRGTGPTAVKHHVNACRTSVLIIQREGRLEEAGELLELLEDADHVKTTDVLPERHRETR